MKRPDTIMIEGHAFSWRRVLELRREQIETWKASQPHQSALFELWEDHRPVTERTTAGRYREPTFFTLLQDAAE